MTKLAGRASDSVTGIAEAVRSFYERHPYPGPVEEFGGAQAEGRAERERLSEHHLFWPSKPFRADRTILIAGCGTIQAARHARQWPRSRVVGIDVSEASIRETATLKEKYGLANLELRHLAVEEAGQLGESFDQIVCTGVLHHLPEPEAGLNALREVLAPRGAMHLMVYAPYGRAGIYLLQEYGRLLGLGTTSAEIRDLVAALKMLPKGHPLWPLLRNSPDFRYDAGLADALLHPRDRPYSVPQLLALIERSGLRFGRWLRQAPYLPSCGAASATPHYPRMARLDIAQQCAAMELYRGTMLRHSAILYRDDDAGDGWAIDFDGSSWPGYVPIRLPETICVEERLPVGKAGVLINPHHTDADIYLPITAAEKKLVDAIDGKLSIAALTAGEATPASGADLFKRLWKFDQIVVDTSRAHTS